jgi:hypothetical protein
MRCINCNNEINGLPLVCPYCHTNPAWFGSQPYDGVKNIGQPGPNDPEITLGLLGLFAMPLLPPVGLTLWGIAGLSLVTKWWRRKKDE